MTRRERLTRHVSNGILTTNLDGSFKLQEHWLLHEDLSCDFTEKRNVLLSDFDIAPIRVDHLVDDGVHV